MKKMIGIAVAALVVFAVLRRFGPALRDRGDRAIAICQEMFEHSSGEGALDEEREKLVLATAG